MLQHQSTRSRSMSHIPAQKIEVNGTQFCNNISIYVLSALNVQKYVQSVMVHIGKSQKKRTKTELQTKLNYISKNLFSLHCFGIAWIKWIKQLNSCSIKLFYVLREFSISSLMCYILPIYFAFCTFRTLLLISKIRCEV